MAELPGHIKKAFRSIERFLPVVDLIIELLDARMPFSSRLDGFVKKLGKASILILGKADLADPNETRKWQDYFKSHEEIALQLNAKNPSSVKSLKEDIKNLVIKSPKSSFNKTKRIMVIGIPNVGKSTLINALSGRKAARVANLPGVTKSIQWVKILGEMELLDLPGILDFGLLKRGEILRMINTLPGKDDDPLLTAKNLFDVSMQGGYGKIFSEYLTDSSDFEKFIEKYSEKMNFLGKQGVVDCRRGSIDFVKRFQSAGLGKITLEKVESRLQQTSIDSDEEQ
ncbi:MAG: 50S ribosome-binding GTPase [Candidatus Riflebacteria bacterium]|nr:50S ribosome-binding GTPase [Candidatus Riflebacteria bacterium]